MKAPPALQFFFPTFVGPWLGNADEKPGAGEGMILIA